MRVSTVAFVVLFSIVGWIDAESAVAGDGVRYLRNTSLLPIVISRSGTYRLKSDLVATNPDVSVIRIEADDVTIDLNGFSIRGPAVCTPGDMGVECTGTGSGSGIGSYGNGAGTRGVRVINGSIRGLGYSGIEGSAIWHIEKVRLVSNGSTGVNVDGEGLLLEVTAVGNGGHGIDSLGLRVKDSEATGNRLSGIRATNASVMNCVASANGGEGIVSSGAAVLDGNVVHGNGGQGIEASGSVVVNNAIHLNRGGAASCTSCAVENNVFYFNAANGSAQVGIYNSTFRGNSVEGSNDDPAVISGESVVAESYVSSTFGAGTALLSSGTVGIAGNVITGGAADIGGPGVVWQLGSNVCGIDTTCP